MTERGNTRDPYVLFATAAIRLWVQERKVLSWEAYPSPICAGADFDRAMGGKSVGVFVSLHRQGQLRGCVGTIEPYQTTLAQEVVANAISASSRDPRFPPVAPQELGDLTVGVDLLGTPFEYDGKIEWDVGRRGVIAAGRGQRGLLLPGLEGVEDAPAQLAIAAGKAGLAVDEVERIWLFDIERHV